MSDELEKRLQDMGVEAVDLLAALRSMGEAIERTEKTVGDFMAMMQPETVHACPDAGSGLTVCCCLPVFELPLNDRIALTGAQEINCKGAGS